MNIEVLRLGHRPQRDKRITTHVCLTARALGAKRARIAEEDKSIATSVSDLCSRFGGEFTLEDGCGWKGPVKQWKADGGVVVHLTMYGEKMSDAIPKIQAEGKDVLIVVGAEKVPGDLYGLANYNVGVGSQPHSEVAALALVMDRLNGGAWEDVKFADAKVQVIPNPRGKTTVSADYEPEA